MFQIRRTALRLLSSPSTSLASKPRSITTAVPFSLRRQQQHASSVTLLARRWASSEAEAKTEDSQTPISQFQPTPQEEVENAIHSDNAAASEDPVRAAATESAEDHQPGVVESAVKSATDAVTGAAASITEAAQSVTGTGSRENSNRSRTQSLAEPKPTIYIGNLFFDVTENDLVKEMARFGTVVKCRLMRDNRGLSKGFGYIDFETTESATKAIEAMNQQLFEGRRLSVQYAAYRTRDFDSPYGGIPKSSKPLNPPSKTLFIGNMSFEMTDRDLNALFKGIRNVIDVRVAIDRRTGQPRGFAHADFIDVKSAMEAMKHLEGKETYGRKLRLDYSYGPSNAPRNQGMPPPPAGGE